MAEVAVVLEDAAPLRVAKRASGAVSPIPGTASLGHEERFPSPSLSGRCRLGEATFAGMGGKEEDAPPPAIRRRQALGGTRTRSGR
jgi:hypothetical protein